MKILNNFPNKFERPEDLVDFNNLPLLMNEQVQGFVDSESCFFVNIRKNSKSSSGTRVELQFSVKQERSNISTLFALNNFFGAESSCTPPMGRSEPPLSRETQVR
jgi:hypothetical protein